MGRLIGYARVSTAEQDLQLQLDALDKAGCDEVFTDKTSRSSHQTTRARCVCRRAGSQGIRWWSGGWIGWGARCRTWWVLVEELLGKGIGFRSLL